jgi:hypothetical protein
MRSKRQPHEHEATGAPSRPLTAASQPKDARAPQQSPASLLRDGRRDPGALTTRDVLQLQRAVGNRAIGQLLVQAMPMSTSALTVSDPGDQWEREADQVSDLVMRMHEPSTAHEPGTIPARLPLQRQRGADGASPVDAPPSVHDALQSSSQPLAPTTRAFFEPRFGYDFSRVRVHVGTAAEQSARDVNALAYTVGHDVVFGAGRFAPGTDEGRRLLAHELTHVVQQSGADGMRLGANALQSRLSRLHLQRQPSSAPATPAAGDTLEGKTKEAIIDGGYADKGEYRVQTSTRTVKETVYAWDRKKGKKVGTEVEKEEAVVDSVFVDGTLERAKRYLDAQWAGGIDVTRAAGGSGDTKGKHIDMPGWVYEYQNKLAAQKPQDYVAKSWEKGNNPNWNEDSFLAQRILEAFLRAWHKKELPTESEIPSNIEELYKRAGVSEKAFGNAQAQLLGDPNVYGWCGPATYNAVVLGLLRNQLRFNTGKPPVTGSTIESRNKQQALFIKNSIKWKNKDITDEELNARYNSELSRMAFMEEVNAQAAFFIGNNSQKQKGWLKGDRFVTGDDAHAKYALQPGDVITQALMNGSPVSGHVLTVIKEMREADFTGAPGTAVSTIYGISGNAGSIGGGSVKIEKFTREMPPATLKADLGAMSGLGNRMTVAVDERKRAENAEMARLAKEQNVPVYQVPKEDVGKSADIRQAEKKSALKASVTAAETSFQEKAGMSYDAFVQAKNAKHPPLNIIQIGTTHKDLIGQIGRLRSQIRAIDDYTNVPSEAAAKGIAYSPSDPRYSEQTGGAGRFRPNVVGHMWITTIIKASEYANAHKVEAELNLDAEERERKIKELGWDKNLSAEEYKKSILERHGVEQLAGSVESLWPGAIAAIEGKGLAKDYR